MTMMRNVFSGMMPAQGLGSMGGVNQTYAGRAGADPKLAESASPKMEKLTNMLTGMFPKAPTRITPQSTSVGTTLGQSATPVKRMPVGQTAKMNVPHVRTRPYGK